MKIKHIIAVSHILHVYNLNGFNTYENGKVTIFSDEKKQKSNQNGINCNLI